MRSLWSWRELIPEALTRVGPAITYDLSVEVPLLYRLCEDAREFLLERRMMGEQGGDVLKVLGFGHVGDGVSMEWVRQVMQGSVMPLINLVFNAYC